MKLTNSVAALFCLSLSLAAPTLALAQTPETLTTKVGITFEPPGDDKPSDSVGGASRGSDCNNGAREPGNCITALIPASKSGLTVSARPTFFVYIPEGKAKQVFFSVVGQDDNYQYQNQIPVTKTGVIASFPLPENAPALEVGKTYQWTFILVDDKGMRPDSPGVSGLIQRVELTAEQKNQLQKAKNPAEQAQIYAKAGIWFDMIGIVGQLKRSTPTDDKLSEIWQKLLMKEGVDATVAAKPLL